MFKNLSRAALVLVALLASAHAGRAQSPAQSTTQKDAQSPAQSAQPAATPQATQTPAPAVAQPGATPQASTLLRREEGHEWAPLLEQKIGYKDWSFKSLKDGAPVSLRELSKGKKLVLVVYFAPWCGNWKAEAPVVWRLYDKYKAEGFEVVGVSEYASAADSRSYFETQGGAPFPVVVESEATAAREQTTHFGYRQASGDMRRWGSPFNVFLEPARLNPAGEVLTEKAWVVGGELIEKDVERFIRGRLGLAEQSAVEPCEKKQ